MSAFVIARETDADAQAELTELFAIAEQDKPARARLVANAGPEAQMFKTAAKEARIGSNGGTSARLVGSFDTVASRILEFNAIGCGQDRGQPDLSTERRGQAHADLAARKTTGSTSTTGLRGRLR